MFSIIITLFLHKLIENQKISSKFLLVFSSLTNQSSNRFSKLFNKSIEHRNSVFVLIYIWIICSCFLTTIFTAVLLGSYSIENNQPFVESIDQFLENDEVMIVGRDALNSIKRLAPNLYWKIEPSTLASTISNSQFQTPVRFTWIKI